MVNCWWLEGVMETATLSMTVLGICTCHHRCSVDTGVYVHVFKSEIINWVGKESEVFLNKSFKLMRNSFSRVCFVNQETKTIDKDLITLCRSIHYHQGTTWLVLFRNQIRNFFHNSKLLPPSTARVGAKLTWSPPPDCRLGCFNARFCPKNDIVYI